MKSLLLSIFLILGISSYSQIIKFQTEAWSIANFDETTQEFEEWKPWVISEAVIVFNVPKGIIDVYSKIEQQYTIISPVAKENKEGILFYSFDCIDISGIRCFLEVIQFTNEKYHMYVRWVNFQIVYQMTRL